MNVRLIVNLFILKKIDLKIKILLECINNLYKQ